MGKRNSDVGRRAWNILRLALLWARKGGVFKRRLATELRLLPKFLRGLGHHNIETTPGRHGIVGYGERQLSFDKTPIFPRVAVKVNGSSSMRFLHSHIPCLNPPVVDFDRDEYDDVVYDCARKSFLTNGEDQDNLYDEEDEEEEEEYMSYEENDNEENNVDTRAEEFIAKFYEQIKLQRQISYLQYNEMLNRSTCWVLRYVCYLFIFIFLVSF